MALGVREKPAAGHRHDYSQRSDLVLTRSRQPSTGKVIAELKFVFWEKMFTARHDTRLWSPHIAMLFPAAPQMASASLRNAIRSDLGAIRKLRNRLAHHEPVFTQNLQEVLIMMEDLIRYRSPATAAWEHQLESATQVLAERPGWLGPPDPGAARPVRPGWPFAGGR